MRHRYNILGKFLKEQRIKANLTQWDLSKKLGYTNAQFISNWERGLASPPPKILRSLINHLDIPEKTLLKLIMQEQHNFWTAQLSSKKRA